MAPALPEGDPQAGLDPKSGLLDAGGKPERQPFPAVAADAFDGGAHPFQTLGSGKVYARSQQKPSSSKMEAENLPWGANKGPCKNDYQVESFSKNCKYALGGESSPWASKAFKRWCWCRRSWSK